MQTIQSKLHKVEVSNSCYRIVELDTNTNTEWGHLEWIWDMLDDLHKTNMQLFDATCHKHFENKYH